MGDNIMMSHTKKRKYQEVINVKFIDDSNVLELAYNSLVKGCKSNDHIKKRCDKLYVLPCRKPCSMHTFGIFLPTHHKDQNLAF